MYYGSNETRSYAKIIHIMLLVLNAQDKINNIHNTMRDCTT